MIVISKRRWDALEDRIAGTLSEFDTVNESLQQAILTQLYNWLTQSTAVISK